MSSWLHLLVGDLSGELRGDLVRESCGAAIWNVLSGMRDRSKDPCKVVGRSGSVKEIKDELCKWRKYAELYPTRDNKQKRSLSRTYSFLAVLSSRKCMCVVSDRAWVVLLPYLLISSQYRAISGCFCCGFLIAVHWCRGSLNFLT